MKKYKDGKIIDIPEEEAEQIRKRFQKRTNSNTSRNYEKRIKELEDTVAMLVAKLDKSEQ